MFLRLFFPAFFGLGDVTNCELYFFFNHAEKHVCVPVRAIFCVWAWFTLSCCSWSVGLCCGLILLCRGHHGFCSAASCCRTLLMGIENALHAWGLLSRGRMWIIIPCDPSREEWLHRATRVRSSSVTEKGRERQRSPDRPGHKHSHKHWHDRRHDSPHRSSREEVLKTAPTADPCSTSRGWQLRNTTSNSYCSSEFISEDGQT